MNRKSKAGDESNQRKRRENGRKNKQEAESLLKKEECNF